MGLVAGIRMSCITRLKHTMNSLLPAQLEKLNDLIELFNPHRSFKIYRGYLSNAERPVIPYL